jgi:hypothetical protein
MAAESGKSPIKAIMLTDLPEPDSPTTASTSPAFTFTAATPHPPPEKRARPNRM